MTTIVRQNTTVLLSILLALLLGGCTAYNAQVQPGRSLAGIQRCFVLANANDSHGLEHRIVAALRARGLTAEAGPRTMMPENTQALITYEDHWAWDFGERLVHLQLSVHDAETQTPQPYAAASFLAKIPGRQTPAAIVGDLVARLFADGKQ